MAGVEEGFHLMAARELELVSRGYHLPLVLAAVKRARGTALRKVEAVSPAIRSQAFYDTLVAELAACETWIRQERGQGGGR